MEHSDDPDKVIERISAFRRENPDVVLPGPLARELNDLGDETLALFRYEKSAKIAQAHQKIDNESWKYKRSFGLFYNPVCIS